MFGHCRFLARTNTWGIKKSQLVAWVSGLFRAGGGREGGKRKTKRRTARTELIQTCRKFGKKKKKNKGQKIHRWLCKKSLFKTFLGLVLNYSISPQLNLIEDHHSQYIKLSAAGLESHQLFIFCYFFCYPKNCKRFFHESWNDFFKEDVINKFST